MPVSSCLLQALQALQASGDTHSYPCKTWSVALAVFTLNASCAQENPSIVMKYEGGKMLRTGQSHLSDDSH